MTSSSVRRCAAATVLLGFSAAGCAQLAAGVAVESDERFRGASLSHSHPDWRLNLTYDHASGWYAGASATGVELDTQRRQLAAWTYAGYAQRWASGLGWELGAAAATFAVDTRYDYGEAFVGLLSQRWNARLSASPSYFGSGRSTVYAELNGGVPLGDPLSRPWTLFGHVGVLAKSGHGPPDEAQRRAHLDASVGMSAGFDGYEVRLTWVVGGHEELYPIPRGQRASVLVIGATAFF